MKLPASGIDAVADATLAQDLYEVAPDIIRLATSFGVSHAIHHKDHLFGWHVQEYPDPAACMKHYVVDGRESALKLDHLLQAHHPEYGCRRLSLLNFASGYGRVSRHLRTMADRFEVSACDIHDDARLFVESALGVPCFLSAAHPAGVTLPSFDAILALSFFSHLPHETWAEWLRKLAGALSPGGVLVFTTVGRQGWVRLGRPGLQHGGIFFAPVSEQHDLSTSDYGSTIVTPTYVFDAIGTIPGLTPLSFRESDWWGYQDVFVVQNTGDAAWQAPNPLLAELDAVHADNERLRDALAAVRASTSWRVTEPLRRLRNLAG